MTNNLEEVEDDLVGVDEIGGNEYIIRFKRKKKEEETFINTTK